MKSDVSAFEVLKLDRPSVYTYTVVLGRGLNCTKLPYVTSATHIDHYVMATPEGGRLPSTSPVSSPT